MQNFLRPLGLSLSLAMALLAGCGGGGGAAPTAGATSSNAGLAAMGGSLTTAAGVVIDGLGRRLLWRP